MRYDYVHSKMKITGQVAAMGYFKVLFLQLPGHNHAAVYNNYNINHFYTVFYAKIRLTKLWTDWTQVQM